jgi:hypothetical protein
VRILSTLQRALELHLPLNWADGRDGTIDGVLPGRLEYDAPVLSFFGTAVWYDSNWYEDPLSIRIAFNPDVSGSVDTQTAAGLTVPTVYHRWTRSSGRRYILSPGLIPKAS